MSKVSFSKTKGLSALGLLTYFFLFLSVALSFSLSHLLRDTGVGEVTQTHLLPSWDSSRFPLIPYCQPFNYYVTTVSSDRCLFDCNIAVVSCELFALV